MLSASISISFETHKLSLPSFGCRKRSVNVFKVLCEIPPLPQEVSGKIYFFSCSLKSCKIFGRAVRKIFGSVSCCAPGQSINALKCSSRKRNSDFLPLVLFSPKSFIPEFESILLLCEASYFRDGDT